jgi:predicted molibdopterin-dependent oxidoreductase YjgC
MSTPAQAQEQTRALFRRVTGKQRERVAFTLDGQALEALAGDTVLTAVLTHGNRLRRTEFSGQARAGFCLMGACQDCWVDSEGGERYQACTTFIEPGMRLLTLKAIAP